MPTKNHDLHGSAPDKSSVALLLADVINDLDFPEVDQFLPHALPMARQIASLKQRAKEQKVPVIYVNNNFGRWRSDFNASGAEVASVKVMKQFDYTLDFRTIDFRQQREH